MPRHRGRLLGLSVILDVPFLAKVCLMTGLAFALPVALGFLAASGLLTSRTLLSYWKQAIGGGTVFAAAVFP